MSNMIYILISIYFNNSCANLVIFYLIAKKQESRNRFVFYFTILYFVCSMLNINFAA